MPKSSAAPAKSKAKTTGEPAAKRRTKPADAEDKAPAKKPRAKTTKAEAAPEIAEPKPRRAPARPEPSESAPPAESRRTEPRPEPRAEPRPESRPEPRREHTPVPPAAQSDQPKMPLWATGGQQSQPAPQQQPNNPSGGQPQQSPQSSSHQQHSHNQPQRAPWAQQQRPHNQHSHHGGTRPSFPQSSQGQHMNNPSNGQNGPSSSNGGGGNGGGGGGGNGGGSSAMAQQGYGQAGAGNKKRRRKKKKGGGGMPGMPGMSGGHSQHSHSHSHSHHSSSQRGGSLPLEEDLEREARELTERYASPKEYAEACKSALNISDLQRLSIEDLHKTADKEGITDAHKYPRHELTFEILKRRAAGGGLMLGSGTLDIAHDGVGFLRSPLFSYLPGPDDVYVSPTQIRRMGLRKGMELKGAVRAPREGERFFALLRVDEVNGGDPTRLRALPIFEDLTPLHPEERYVLETSPDEIEMRIVDLVAPIGRGQRGLIVAPPRTGKTVLLQKMTRAIAKNYPEVKIIVLLIDERPEEVTDFRRNTIGSVEVIASTFDEDASRHVAVCEMVHEKSRRYVEFGQHVVILLDSITRLARAYNAGTSHSGKIMSGGIDSNALQRPKKFFGNARAIENGGSLTILGTALVDTGSKADEVIFEEFKGTGNSELHLERKLVDKRIWPAIDVAASGTRREELLLDPKELELTYRLRKVLSDMNVVEAMELMKSRLKKCKTNAEFLMSMQMGA